MVCRPLVERSCDTRSERRQQTMAAVLSLPRCSGGFLGPAVTQTLEQQALSVVSQPPWASLTELLSLKRILKGSIYQMSGIFRPRCLNDLFRRAVLHNLSFAHHQHPITERLNQSQIMADKQKRKSVLLLQSVGVGRSRPYFVGSI